MEIQVLPAVRKEETRCWWPQASVSRRGCDGGALGWGPDLSLRVCPSTALTGQVTCSLGVTFSTVSEGCGVKELLGFSSLIQRRVGGSGNLWLSPLTVLRGRAPTLPLWTGEAGRLEISSSWVIVVSSSVKWGPRPCPTGLLGRNNASLRCSFSPRFSTLTTCRSAVGAAGAAETKRIGQAERCHPRPQSLTPLDSPAQGPARAPSHFKG